MADSLVDNIERIIGFQLLGTIFITISLFFFGVFNDEIMYRIYGVIEGLEASGVSPAWVTTFVASIQDTVLMIPTWLDIMWLVLFIILVAEIWAGAYYLKREGYVSALGILTLGSLVSLFIMGIIGQISTWFQDVFLATILPSISLTNTFFELYLNNLLVINILIIVVSVILNFIDLDFKTFFSRKEGEKYTGNNDEVL